MTFAFPSEEETKSNYKSEIKNDDESIDKILSKDELYELLQTRNDELDDVSEKASAHLMDESLLPSLEFYVTQALLQAM